MSFDVIIINSELQDLRRVVEYMLEFTVVVLVSFPCHRVTYKLTYDIVFSYFLYRHVKPNQIFTQTY